MVDVEQLTQVAFRGTVTALLLLHFHLGVGVGQWWCSPTKAATPRMAHYEGFGVELNEGGGSEGAHRLPNLTKLVVHGGFCQPGKWMKVTKEKLYEQ